MDSLNQQSAPRHHDRFIQAIAAFKFLKTILFLLAALGAVGLMQENIADQARDWASDLAFTSGQRLVPQVIAMITGLSRSKIGALGLVALFYAALFATEKPRFVSDSSSSTSGNSDRTISTVPSREALSTTQTRARAAGGCARSDIRHGLRRSRERNETMTTSSIGVSMRLRV